MLNISLKTALRELKEEAISDISSKEPPTRDLSFKVSTCDNNKSLIHSKELSYLNSNWHNWMIANDISSHRPLIGKVISRVKRFVIDVVWTYLFKDYVEREKKFQENLVRYLNDNINYIDKKNYEIFWQIINKLDKDISSIVERVDNLFDHAECRTNALEFKLETKLKDLKKDSLSPLELKRDFSKKNEKEGFLVEVSKYFTKKTNVLVDSRSEELIGLLSDKKIEYKKLSSYIMGERSSLLDNSIDILFIDYDSSLLLKTSFFNSIKALISKFKQDGIIIINFIESIKYRRNGNYIFDSVIKNELSLDELKYFLKDLNMEILEQKTLPFRSYTENFLKKIELDDSIPPRWIHSLKPINENIDYLNSVFFDYKNYLLIYRIKK